VFSCFSYRAAVSYAKFLPFPQRLSGGEFLKSFLTPTPPPQRRAYSGKVGKFRITDGHKAFANFYFF
jgi:hypothetical protein